MRPSRGMGDMRASKMPKGKVVRRKDNPNKVEVYRKGGITKKHRPPSKSSPPRLDKALRNYKERIPSKDFT